MASADSWDSQGLYQHQEAHDQGHGEKNAQEEAVHHAGQALPVLMAALGSSVAAEGVGNGGDMTQQSFLMAQTLWLMARACWRAGLSLRRLGTGRCLGWSRLPTGLPSFPYTQASCKASEEESPSPGWHWAGSGTTVMQVHDKDSECCGEGDHGHGGHVVFPCKRKNEVGPTTGTQGA